MKRLHLDKVVHEPLTAILRYFSIPWRSSWKNDLSRSSVRPVSLPGAIHLLPLSRDPDSLDWW